MPNSSDDFDGYRKWLGIANKNRPPSHYEVLGLSLDEDDHEVIQAAADQRRQYVQSKKGQGHDAIVAEILYRIGEAETTLQNPQLRRDYDREQKLFEKRRKNRQVDPFAPLSRIRSRPGPVVGEGSGIVKTFAGIMVVMAIGFGVMAWFSSQIPWQQGPKNLGTGLHANQNPMDHGQGVLFAHPPGNPAPEPVTKSGLPSTKAPDAREKPLPEPSDDMVTTDVTIQGIDLPARTITVSHKGKTANFEIGKKIQVLVDGVATDVQALKRGQQATISFLASYNLIAKIEIAANSNPLTGIIAKDAKTLITPSDPDDLAKKLAGTTWINSNNVTFAWTTDGRFLHRGIDQQWNVLDGRRGQIVFGPNHVDTLVFNDAITEFKQLIKGGPDSFQGKRDETATPASEAPPSSPSPTDDLVTLDAQIASIDTDARSISVTRKSKTTVLEFSRKTEVIIDGKPGAIDSLKADQPVLVTLNPELNLITKIEVVPGDAVSESSDTPAEPGSDEIVTIEATLSEINLDSRTISATRKAKTTLFDVSRKTEVLIDGKPESLDSLKNGQTATITVNPELNMIVKIEITSVASPSEEK